MIDQPPGEKDERTVLIVEDDEDIRAALREMLEEEGYRVATAIDGEEGLAQVKSSRPGLVLLDLLMPGMNGLEFLAALRADQTFASLPVVVVSAGGRGSAGMAVEAGATRFLPKPLKLARLLSVVQELCGPARASA
jgi:CheY-like chemotaxis protein